ncbi:Versicolorin reductase [Madurella fahalii]|uniref:Versicolorin reductase n=1 Tax=Madurella fahalii TaxID=1157608 RepID=A0ABQ0GNK4_9PEZI
MAPDSLSLAGKTAIVTGSGRENGIGAAIARALGRNGARVAINYVSESSAPRAAKVAASIESLGAEVTVVQADVSTPEGAAKLVKETLEKFHTDKIDILINNAGTGTGQGTLLADLTPVDVQKAFALNTFSTLYTVQAALPYIPSGGRIVNIGSVVSKINNMLAVGVYGASKAAQDYLTAALAAELGSSEGITVNTVAPGPVKTDAASWFPDGELKDDVMRKLAVGARLGRVAGDPEEVADAVLLVVSNGARWITGQYIAASGGITA